MNKDKFYRVLKFSTISVAIFSIIFLLFCFFLKFHRSQSSQKQDHSQEVIEKDFADDPDDKIINIFYSADDFNALATCVSMASVLKNVSKDKEINFYIVYLDDKKFNDENMSKIESLKTKIRDFKLHFISFDSNKLSNFDKQDWHASILIKLWAPSLFPNIKRILWLDDDVIILKNIDEFYSQDLSEKYLAAVDISSYYNKYFGEYKNSRYWITAGVGLYNLQELRKDKIQDKLIECAKKYAYQNMSDEEKKEILGGVEEYALTNVIKKEKAILLPYRYCIMCFLDVFGKGHFKSEEEEIKKSIAMHFSGAWKPWKGRVGILDYYYEFWEKYFKLTPYYKKIE
ncbi:MAG: hypothetical protein LBI55_02735 [Oscillospiraceae bacterium]|jgi:lipopolysaccharide biosynthesis glycosyltransferase|nr:hypothetical protein [Oscillospiraceae bacterium]